MAVDNVNLTYEALFELVMREKNRAELQILPPAFYSDFVSYLKKKKEMLHESIPLETLYQDTHVERLSKQVRNIKSLIRELYERREKKIIIMAMNQVRIDEEIIDKKLFLPEELEFFNSLCEIFKRYKNEILYSLLQGKEPNLPSKLLSSHLTLSFKSDNPEVDHEVGHQINHDINFINEKLENKQLKNSEEIEQSRFSTDNQNIDNSNNLAHNNSINNPIGNLNINNNTNMNDNFNDGIYLFIKEFIEPFVGENLEVYGPYKEGDKVRLPENLANILINDKKAEPA